MGVRSSIRNGFSNPSSLPPWWSVVGVVAIAVFILYGAVRAIPSDGAPTSSPVPNDTPAPTVTAAVPTTTPAAETLLIPDGAGGVREVPAMAVAAATAAARGLFSGDLSEVVLANGSSFPSVGRVWPDPQVTGPVQVTQNGTAMRMLFDVDPDGDGPEVARRLGIDVVEQSTGWAVRF